MIVILACEPFLLSGRNDFGVAQEARGAIVIISGYTEYVRHTVLPPTLVSVRWNCQSLVSVEWSSCGWGKRTPEHWTVWTRDCLELPRSGVISIRPSSLSEPGIALRGTFIYWTFCQSESE